MKPSETETTPFPNASSLAVTYFNQPVRFLLRQEGNVWAGMAYTPYCSIKCPDLLDNNMRAKWLDAVATQVDSTYAAGNYKDAEEHCRIHELAGNWIETSTA